MGSHVMKRNLSLINIKESGKEEMNWHAESGLVWHVWLRIVK